MSVPQILCVDDEPLVLEGLEMNLGFDYQVVSATSGAQALRYLDQAQEPVEVILSDMRMPGMDGARFLAEARRRSPDSTRLLLTGQADLASAVAAINEGGIYRFLLKPCPAQQLKATVAEAVELHRLRLAERDLLSRTIRESMLVLSETLSLSSPLAFGRSARIRGVVLHLWGADGEEPPWDLDVAATLSQLGCIALPRELLERELSDNELGEAEEAKLRAHPDVAAGLLARVPRMESVAELVRLQLEPPAEQDPEDLACLKLAVAFERALRRTGSPVEAAKSLRSRWAHRGEWVDRLAQYRAKPSMVAERAVCVAELQLGMVLDEDIRSPDGRLWIARGHEVTPIVQRRLKAIAAKHPIVEPFRVVVSA